MDSLLQSACVLHFRQLFSTLVTLCGARRILRHDLLRRLNQRRRVRLVSTGIFAQDRIVFGEVIRHVEVLAERLGVIIDGTA